MHVGGGGQLGKSVLPEAEAPIAFCQQVEVSDQCSAVPDHIVSPLLTSHHRGFLPLRSAAANSVTEAAG